jgi:hypothetical protein
MVDDVNRVDFDESLCTAAELDPSMFAPVRPSTEEATAVGAAMVAGVGTGFFADFTTASVAVRLAPAAINPDPEATKTYADAYRRYLAAFDAVESALAALPVLSAQPTPDSLARPT